MFVQSVVYSSSPRRSVYLERKTNKIYRLIYGARCSDRGGKTQRAEIHSGHCEKASVAELFLSQPTWKKTFIAFNPTFHSLMGRDSRDAAPLRDAFRGYRKPRRQYLQFNVLIGPQFKVRKSNTSNFIFTCRWCFKIKRVIAGFD